MMKNHSIATASDILRPVWNKLICILLLFSMILGILPLTMPTTAAEENLNGKAVAIAGGANDLYVLTDQGTVWRYPDTCDYYTYYMSATPPSEYYQVAGPHDIVAIEAGFYSFLALQDNGIVWEGDQQLPELHEVIQISSNGTNCMALTAQGDVWEWMYGSSPQQKDLGGVEVISVASLGLHYGALVEDPGSGRRVVLWESCSDTQYDVLFTQDTAYAEALFGGRTEFWVLDNQERLWCVDVRPNVSPRTELSPFDSIIDVGSTGDDIFDVLLLRADGTVYTATLSGTFEWYPSPVFEGNFIDVTMNLFYAGFALRNDGAIFRYNRLCGGVLDPITDFAVETTSLIWPAASGEVTLWYGQVDDQYTAVNKGINIQGEANAAVRSVGHGTVNYIGYDATFQYVVYVEFMWNDMMMEARYGHLSSVNGLEVGSAVTIGQTLGYMGTHADTGKGLLEFVLLQNYAIVNPMNYLDASRPAVDLTFLEYPFATILDTNGLAFSPVRATAASVDTHNKDYRYQENLDLKSDEVYLRKLVVELAKEKNSKVTLDDNSVEKLGYLSYSADYGVATVNINGANAYFCPGLGNARIVNQRMVVNKKAATSACKNAVAATENDLGTLSNWYADSDIIDRWKISDLKLYREQLVPAGGTADNDFYFYSGMTEAREQWAETLGVNIAVTTDKNEANITYYGGTRDAIINSGELPELPTGVTGLTWVYAVPEGRWTYKKGLFSSRKTGFNVVKVVGVIVNSGASQEQTYNTCIHEMGHAMGWDGHSDNTADIMYSRNTTIQTLTDRDKSQLTQVYTAS
ncbi:MAG: peptidoglycan DD-metalloendopeptidase family protein [Oscillospiraceae bacterium]|nr:peptidoglycan DD-metalloendopeptidase family protein [Oscillospiraceae bacterium]